jgi:long-chain fatty acid transport protein
VTLFVKGLAVRKTIVALFILAPSLALASGYSLPNTNPRDLGLCASSVAAQRDAGAAFALPAALARLEGPSASLSFGAVNVFNTWKDPGTGQKVDMDTTISPLGTLAASYGGKLSLAGTRGWGVGLGIQPFGGAIVSWPADWPGRYRIVDVDRKVFSGIVSAGLEVLPRVRIGGGFLYYYTTQTFRQKAWMGPPFGAAGTPDAEAKLDMNGGAPSFSASLEVEPIANVPLTIGVDYKHKATQDLDGDVTWSGTTPGARLASPFYNDQGVKETLTIPNLLNIGVSYRVVPPVLVTATFTLDRWVVYDQDRFVGDLPGTPPLAVARDYTNGQTYRVGVEYDLSPVVQLRGGLQRDISGLSKRVYSPTLPDASSWGGSLGATYKFARGLSANAAVFYARMDKVKVPDDAVGLEPPASLGVGSPAPTGTFRGEYTPSAIVYDVGITWTPGTP